MLFDLLLLRFVLSPAADTHDIEILEDHVQLQEDLPVWEGVQVLSVGLFMFYLVDNVYGLCNRLIPKEKGGAVRSP